MTALGSHEWTLTHAGEDWTLTRVIHPDERFEFRGDRGRRALTAAIVNARVTELTEDGRIVISLTATQLEDVQAAAVLSL